MYTCMCADVVSEVHVGGGHNAAPPLPMSGKCFYAFPAHGMLQGFQTLT